MGMIPMVEKTVHCSELVEWPLFYMNDFSVTGLLVTELPAAVKALEIHGFRLVHESGGVKIRFDGSGQIARIMDALSAEKISFEMTDLMDHAYQG